MDKECEEKTIEAFFVKRLQERILFELSSPKRRKDAIWRLSNYGSILNPNYIIKIPKPNSEPDEIKAMLKTYGAGEFCYCISHNDDIDGKQIELTTALNAATGYGMPSVISCVPGKLAYYEGEQCYGPPTRLILRKE